MSQKMEIAIRMFDSLRDGETCPVCGGVAIQSDYIPTVDGSNMTLDMSCAECESQWVEYFKLANIKIKKIGTRKPEEVN